jgi:hypothetical protein
VNDLELHSYEYAGLAISSEIALPEWSVFETVRERDEPDVRIILDPSRFETEMDVGSSDATLFVLRIPGVGRFRICEGRTIAVQACDETPLHRLRPWLLGSAWAALCYQRGMFLLHASGVVMEGAAVLFCAPPQRGKSTIAAELNRRGYALVSDDLCCLKFTPHHRPVVYPSAPRLKLWADTLAQLSMDISGMEPDPAREGKFHLSRVSGSGSRPIPLGAVYVLEWGDLELCRLRGLDALNEILSSALYRVRLLEKMGLVDLYAQWTINLLQQVPVWQLSRPREFAAAGATIELLLSHQTRLSYY